MWMKSSQLFTTWSLFLAVECGLHSLQFLSTGYIHPGSWPQFEQVTLFDGVPIAHCDSLTKWEELKPILESKNISTSCEQAYYDMVDALHEIYQFINETVYVQRRRGCIQSANGAVSSFEDWAVNGNDFIRFDPETQKWMTQSLSAEKIKHSWDNKDFRNHVFGQFIREQCLQRIQGIILRQKEQRIDLRVFAKPIDTNKALLRCHVTSTEKTVRSVHLLEDGPTKANWISVMGPLPSDDGSVIFRLTAEIFLKTNTNTYSCRVQTGSHNITVTWDGNTLDGRHLFYSSQWRFLTGFIYIVIAIAILSSGTKLLLKYVQKSYRTSRDQQRLEQLVIMLYNLENSASSTDNSEFYDPEYFANHIDGVLR